MGLFRTAGVSFLTTRVSIFRYSVPIGQERTRNQGTNFVVTERVLGFPWPPLSDADTSSEYRYSALDGTARVLRSEETPFIFFLSVSVLPRRNFLFSCA